MHPTLFLRKLIRDDCQTIHKARIFSLFDAVKALTKGTKLTLVALGRSLESNADTKHNIKKVDRLLGNTKIHNERILVYRSIATKMLAETPRPLILVDWSPITKCVILRTVFGVRALCSHSLQHSERENEPGLIMSSLSKRLTKEAIAIYRTRMKIEQSFRDFKSHRFGFSFSDEYNKKTGCDFNLFPWLPTY